MADVIHEASDSSQLSAGGWRRIAWVLAATQTPTRPLIAIGLMALVAGISEAGALVVIVALAADALGGAPVATIGPIGLASRSPGQLAGMCGLLISLAFVSNVLASRSQAGLSTGAVARVRFDLVSAHLKATARSQERMPDGKMPELTGIGAYQAETALGSVGACVTSGALLVAYLGIALLSEPLAAAASIVGGATLVLLTRPIAHRARSAMRRYVDRSAELLQWCAQIVDLTTELRVFGVEEQALAEARDRNERAADAGRRARFLLAASPALYQTVALGLVLVGVLVARESDVVEPAALAAVTVLLVRALSLVQRMSLAVQGLGAATPHVEDVVSTISGFRRTTRSTGSRQPVKEEGGISVDAVSFAYEAASPVLRDVSFSIAHGESVAIVGPSGGGKSTLLKLLLGLLQPDSGSIRLSGVDLRDIDERNFRALVAFVPQDNRLLLGSVADNVAFLRDIDADAIERALRSSAIEGAATIGASDIGAGASAVSGGQRQRIGIARALVGDPAVLLLDEPTSALDHASEAVVNETLRSARGSVTVVVIAHRASTVAACDRVLLLDDGRLRADGPLSRLIETEPYLEAMFESSGGRSASGSGS